MNKTIFFYTRRYLRRNRKKMVPDILCYFLCLTCVLLLLTLLVSFGQTLQENEARVAAMKANAAKHMPLGRLCTPEDIAGICMLLVTDESAYVTGYTIDATGGRYIYNT